MRQSCTNRLQPRCNHIHVLCTLYFPPPGWMKIINVNMNPYWKYVKSFQFPNHAEHFLFSYFSLSNGPPVWAKRFPTEWYCLNHFLISEPLIFWWSLSLLLMIYQIIIIIISRSFSNSLLFQRGWLLPLRPHLPG